MLFRSEIRPISIAKANEYVEQFHRHHGKKTGCRFAIAVYKNDEILLKPQHIELNKLTEFLSDKGEYTFITNDEMDLNNKKCSYDPNILLIVKRYCQKDNINPHLVNPEYLKLTAAEEARKSD